MIQPCWIDDVAMERLMRSFTYADVLRQLDAIPVQYGTYVSSLHRPVAAHWVAMDETRLMSILMTESR